MSKSILPQPRQHIHSIHSSTLSSYSLHTFRHPPSRLSHTSSYPHQPILFIHSPFYHRPPHIFTLIHLFHFFHLLLHTRRSTTTPSTHSPFLALHPPILSPTFPSCLAPPLRPVISPLPSRLHTRHSHTRPHTHASPLPMFAPTSPINTHSFTPGLTEDR